LILARIETRFLNRPALWTVRFICGQLILQESSNYWLYRLTERILCLPACHIYWVYRST